MPTIKEEAERWAWPCYNPPGLLIGPVLMIKGPTGCWVPDWSRPGVHERMIIEIDFHEDMHGIGSVQNRRRK